MLMTKHRRLRMFLGTLETANWLMVKLALQNRVAVRTYPSSILREYLQLSNAGPWTTSTVFDFLKMSNAGNGQPHGRVTLEHVPDADLATPISELAFMALITRAVSPAAIFEIGTFNGRTALNFAINSPEDCVVYTLDLPEGGDVPADVNVGLGSADQHLLATRRVGSDYRGRDEAAKIKQLFGDSREFDFTPYYGKMDIVFVDGGHTYEIAASDTEQAIRMCRPGGVIIWHDFANYGSYHDVTRAILDRLPPKEIVQLENSQLAAYWKPSER